MEPLLRRIEALSDDGRYSLGLVLSDGQERTVLVRYVDGAVDIPQANLPAGWPSTSASFQAASAAVRALHEARELAGGGHSQLSDVPGGWDVMLGNVVLSDSGRPVCVSHAELEPVEAGKYQCEVCGASARFAA